MQFDIIIVGGGMVGAALACALARGAYKVALIDASSIAQSHDHRLIALSYRSVCLLKNLKCWPLLENFASSIDQIHVSHRNHFGTTRIKAHELGLMNLGQVIPAKYITPALYNNLDGVTLIRPATLKHLSQFNDQVTLTVETPQGDKSFSTQFLIGADGTQSTVRKLLAIPVKTFEYGQSALVTTTQLARPHEGSAYERFLVEGAIAMLPLLENKVATIWTDTTARIDEHMRLSDSDFLAKLQQQFGYRLGKLMSVSERYLYPLQRVQAEKQVDRRVILIGNAAHTVHPIAAQGLNLSFYEIAVLADFFMQESHLQLDSIKFPQTNISLNLSHQLHTFFSSDFFIHNTLRKIGLLSLDLFQPLKALFGKKIVHQSGSPPTLMLD